MMRLVGLLRISALGVVEFDDAVDFERMDELRVEDNVLELFIIQLVDESQIVSSRESPLEESFPLHSLGHMDVLSSILAMGNSLGFEVDEALN